MAAKVYYSPFIPAFSSNGAPVPGARLNFYLTGTSTRTPVYAESGLLTELTNPVVADSSGKFPNIYLDEAVTYRVVQTNAAGAQIGDAIDPYVPGQALRGSDGPIGPVGPGGNLQLGQFSRLISKLQNEDEDANLVILSDSTGDATDEWPYLLADDHIAPAFPAWTVKIRYFVAGAYGTATTLQTGSGTRTLTVWVAAQAGSAADYYTGGDFTAAVIEPDPDAVLVSYGHNGDIAGTGPYNIGPYRQLSYFNALADRLARDIPNVPVVAIGQNPSVNDNGSNPTSTDDGFMSTRLKVLRPFYARRGWGFIDVHGAFLQSPLPLTSLLADDVHPNPTGSALWASTVYAVMSASRGSQQTGQNAPSQIVRGWLSYAELNDWAKTNITATKQTTSGRYQTEGSALTATITSNASAGWIYVTAVDGNDIQALAGRFATFTVWVRNPTSNVGNAGRVDIEDNAGITTSNGFAKGDGFVAYSVTRLIDPGATFIKLYIYPADDAQATANALDIDRASLSLGLDAVDPLRLATVSGRELRIHGSSASGLGSIFNSNSTAIGVRGLPTETADPATAWTSDFSADGFAAKDTGSAYASVFVTYNGVYVGSGSAAATLRIGYATGTGLNINADWLPTATNSFDLGATTFAWRNAYLGTGLYVGANKVVGAQGAAVADATDAASVITQLNALLARLRTHGLIAA